MLAQVAQQHLQERLQKQQELQTQEDLQLVQQQKQGQMQDLVAAATAVAGSAEEAAGLAGAPEAETGVVVEECFLRVQQKQQHQELYNQQQDPQVNLQKQQQELQTQQQEVQVNLPMNQQALQNNRSGPVWHVLHELCLDNCKSKLFLYMFMHSNFLRVLRITVRIFLISSVVLNEFSLGHYAFALALAFARALALAIAFALIGPYLRLALLLIMPCLLPLPLHVLPPLLLRLPLLLYRRFAQICDLLCSCSCHAYCPCSCTCCSPCSAPSRLWARRTYQHKPIPCWQPGGGSSIQFCATASMTTSACKS